MGSLGAIRLTKGRMLRINKNTALGALHLVQGVNLDIGALKLTKGMTLVVNEKEVGDISGTLKLKKGVYLDLSLFDVSHTLGSIVLKQGSILKVCTSNLKKGCNLLNVSSLKNEILKYERESNLKNVNKVETISKTDDISSLDIGDTKKIIKEVKIKDNIKEQKGNESKLIEFEDKPYTDIKRLEKNKDVTDTDIEVDDGITYDVGMSLYDFLKENKNNRTEEVVLKYYTKNDLEDLLKKGKVLKKRGKLII